jgi:hypothetical protein
METHLYDWDVKGVFQGYSAIAPYVLNMSYRSCALLMRGYKTLLWNIAMNGLTRHLNVSEQCDQ